jgi:SRSO17 transposase
MDRALHPPKSWTDDPRRLKAAHAPGDIGFSTKPQLAARMIAYAIAARVPFAWVAAIRFSGRGRRVRRRLTLEASGS